MRLEQWLACFHSNLSARQALQIQNNANKGRSGRLPKQLDAYLSGSRGDGVLRQSIEEDLEWSQKSGHHLVAYDSEYYPPLLGKIQDAPCALFVLGDPTLLKFPSLAIVGPRKPSGEGIYNARIFSAELAVHGLCITSGLAEGVDGVAHRSALDKDGRTLAVIGTGIDRVYPHRHISLTEKMIGSGRGAIVSIFRRGTSPLPGNFPRRNRIISGISMATLVIEAGLRSGAMITARLAGEQGRDVFAIPGSIHAPLSKGCNKLIKDGALLTETTEDITAHLPAIYRSHANSLDSRDSPDAPNTLNPRNLPLGFAENADPKKQKQATHRIHNKAGTGTERERERKRESDRGAETNKQKTPEATQVSAAHSTKIVNRSLLSDAAYKLLETLNYRPTHPDELAQPDGTDIAQLDSCLTELELHGLISNENGCYRKLPADIRPNK